MVISSVLLRLSVPSLLSLLPWPSHALVSIGGAGASRIFVGSESDAAELRDANIGAVVEIAGSPLALWDFGTLRLWHFGTSAQGDLFLFSSEASL